MNKLVNANIKNENGKLFVSSRDIAKGLEKEHKDVLRKIREVLDEREFSPVTYIDEKGESRPEYMLDKDAFILLVMNYTGYNDFKRAYIKRSNEMEEIIKNNNDGSKSVWVSAYISHNAPLTSSDQDFNAGLPKIPRAAKFSGADDFNDEQNPKIYFNNPAGFRLQLKMEAGGDDYLIVRDNLSSPSSPYTFSLTEAERNKLRALCPNSNKLAVRFTVATYMPGSSSPGNHSYGDKTMSIVNANTTFTISQLSYQDTKSSIVAITNNNQLIVRNQSTLQVSFTESHSEEVFLNLKISDNF